MNIEIDEIIRTKRKTIALTITSDARLVIRSPLRTSEDYIKKFVLEKQKWIIKTKILMQNRNVIHPKKQFVEGEGFLYLGKYYKLKIVMEYTSVGISDDFILLPLKDKVIQGKKLTEWYKKEAHKIIKNRADWVSNSFGFSYNSIKINSAKRRWGSCNHKNSLNFTWRLIMAPIEVVDYVVLHELAHTQVKDHSAKFWTKVKVAMPDFKKHKKWLIENQRVLEI